MEYIIHELLKNVTSLFEKTEINLSSLSEGIKLGVKDLGKNLLKYLLESIDIQIRESSLRKKNWYVERYDERTIITSLGKVTFMKTYYVNKVTKRYAYLLDQVMGINKYQRLDESVEANLLKHANYLSYEKAGDLFSEDIKLSKETVRNKLKKLGESSIGIVKESNIKKRIKELYIDADEDHICLQTGKRKINKLIYVYEGKLEESKGRRVLVNKYYFGSVKRSSESLWEEVLNYIYANYDMEYLEKIYIQGDGANWIKTGVSVLDKSIHVIDMFHLNKEIMKLAGGNLEEGFGKELKELIYLGELESFKEKSKEILELEKDEKRFEKKKKALGYIKNQWKGIKEFLKYKDSKNLGCSAEGHVSHVLASRMSSRPKGWSIDGLENMTKLRLFMENSGDINSIKEAFKKRNIEIAKDRKERLQNIKRLKKKVGETIHNITAVNIGHINGTFNAIKSITRY